MKLLRIKVIAETELVPVDAKFWRCSNHAACDFVTDEGTWHARTKPSWLTDLRSGCDLINPVISKWGNPLYTWCILGHDIAFGGLMSFDLANELFLRQGLALSGQIGEWRASLAAAAVQRFGRSHYYDFEDVLPPPYEANRPLESLTLEAK